MLVSHKCDFHDDAMMVVAMIAAKTIIEIEMFQDVSSYKILTNLDCNDHVVDNRDVLPVQTVQFIVLEDFKLIHDRFHHNSLQTYSHHRLSHHHQHR